MTARISHFAIEADNVERARALDANVFGWTLEPSEPPDVYHIKGAGLLGALQERQAGAAMGRRGHECTLAVDNLAATLARIEAEGGTVLGEPFTIPGVGERSKFKDTEGEAAIVMQDEAGVLEPARFA